MKTSNFRFNSKRAFLTYPQCNEEHDNLYNSINGQYPIKYAVIAQELHEDGNKHLHAAIEFTKKLDITNEKAFDIKSFHPNIQSPKKWLAVIQYCKKDNNFKEYGTTSTGTNQQYICCYALAKQGFSEEEYFSKCLKERIPFQFAQHAWSLIQRDSTSSTLLESTVFTGLVQENLLEWTPLIGKSNMLLGPSGIGKTTIAMRKAPKPCLWVTHMDTLKEFKKDFHKSIIFDDMEFNHMPRAAQLYIVDPEKERQIHIRYGRAKIPGGITKIFTANYWPFIHNDEAIMRRINVCNYYPNASLRSTLTHSGENATRVLDETNYNRFKSLIKNKFIKKYPP